MSKLYFYYSSMNAGKSTSLLQANHNYIERGMETMMLTPAIDNRAGVGVIKSRIGLSEKAIAVHKEQDLYVKVASYVSNPSEPKSVSAIFVDEAQFLTKEQVDQLSDVVDILRIPVLAYGLRTDAFGELFPGSERLLAIADKLIEQKAVCKCGSKATHVVRFDEHGVAVTGGSQVDIGGNDKYESYCRKHWKAEMGKLPLKLS
ncbi:thymidine kinase [Vibrio splendidus]|nr:thymidine kinase [Vibrio splendidus]MCC4881481.1 thymidine kinase [Vibrio splendidus]